MDSVVHTDMFLRMVLLSLAELTGDLHQLRRLLQVSPQESLPLLPALRSSSPPSIFILITLLPRQFRVPRYSLLYFFIEKRLCRVVVLGYFAC